jgi:hypothetical protein
MTSASFRWRDLVGVEVFAADVFDSGIGSAVI